MGSVERVVRGRVQRRLEDEAQPGSVHAPGLGIGREHVKPADGVPRVAAAQSRDDVAIALEDLGQGDAITRGGREAVQGGDQGPRFVNGDRLENEARPFPFKLEGAGEETG